MKRDKRTGFVAVFVALLLALTMVPAAGVQSAFADEQFASEGLIYKAVDGGAVLVGFEDGGSLGDNVTVPEKVTGGSGELTVTGVDVAEGQSAPGVKALTLPQTVGDINTKSLAVALPELASINVDGTAGAYSSANGLLFRQADEAASSDGSTVRVANRELLWTPPATVIARIPGTCKRVAAGAFTDAAALETIMAFSTVESIARPEKGSEGNVVKEGAFDDEQVSRVNIVIPISATVQPEGEDRISTDVFLSEQVGLDVKQTPWCDYGFAIERFTVGIPHGSTSVTVAVPEDGKVGTPVITIGNYIDYPQWNPKPGEVDWPTDGLVFEYKADMTVSVRWDGSKEAIPAHLELPAYVVENGVKTAVTEVAPNAFEGATQLESVVIPEGVTTIGESAFAGCSGLKTVSFPSTLKTVDYAAFKGAGLESAEIPSGVRWIGGEAFADCLKLDSFEASESRAFSDTALENSFELNSMAGDGGISHYSSAHGTAYGIDSHVVDALKVDYPGYTFIQSDPYYVRGLSLAPMADEVADLTLSDASWVTNVVDETRMWWGYNETPMSNMYLHTKSGNAPIFSFNINDRDYKPSQSSTNAVRFDQLKGSEYGRLFYSFGKVQLDTRWNPAGSTRVAEPPLINSYHVVNPNESNNIHFDPPAVEKDGWGSYVDFFIATLNRYRIDYDPVTSSIGGVRDGVYTVEDPDYTLKEPTQRAGYTFLGWTWPGHDEVTSNDEVDLRDVVADIDAENVAANPDGKIPIALEGHWEANSYNVSYDEGAGIGGEWVTAITGADSSFTSYKADTGMSALLSGERVVNTGFWFKGWYAEPFNVWESGTTRQVSGIIDSIPAGAYSDVKLHVVWAPKYYTVKYDTTPAGKKTDGGAVVGNPADKTYVHPDAAKQVTTNIPADTRQYGAGASAGNAYVDLTGIDEVMCTDYSLSIPEDTLGGYPFLGWSKQKVTIGELPKVEGDAKPYYTHLVDPDTKAVYFQSIFYDNETSFWGDATKPMTSTVFGVWSQTDMTKITLEKTEPTHTNNVDKEVNAATVDGGDGLTTTFGTESIRFWMNHGFVGQEGIETTGTLTPSRMSAGYKIDTTMGLKAPVRYGFEFLGWGDSADKIYIAYDEDVAHAGEETGFTLTDAGAALVSEQDLTDAEKDKYKTDEQMWKYTGSTSWKAIWKVRTYTVTLRVPSYAVENVDVTGASTQGPSDDKDYTQAKYDGYMWREGGASDTGGGATASWYVAERTWNYFDRIEYPKFTTRDGYYSYDGWFDATKPTSTDSTDKALEETSAVKVATFATMRPEKWGGAGVHVTGGTRSESDGFTTDSGLDLPETVFNKKHSSEGAAVSGYVDGTKELWLWTSPIRINVASPIGVYLCTVNSKGEAVEPYVVGNDKRTQLEAPATFKVAQNSHDLQLVGVTAEDVTSFERQYSGEGDAAAPVKDGKGVHLVDEATVKTEADDGTEAGLCDKILDPVYTDKVDNYKFDEKGSRMFWVSPVQTATDDQTGVVFDGNAVNSRRYFGFGYTLPSSGTSESGGGDGGAGSEGTDPAPSDNTIYDDLDNTSATSKSYLLSDFVLRKPSGEDGGSADGGAPVAGQGALAYLGKVDGSDTYRFYYGLDLSRAEFDLNGLKDLVSNSSEIGYDSTFDMPLLRVKFTFAAARNTGISYYSARLADDAVMMPADDGADGIPTETEITVGGSL